VDPLYSRSPANLDLMKRPDLKATLTKLHLWNQTQFSKVVFVDADVVALRAPDELFEVDADLAAAPDVGWPDCFNSVG
jgi:glycogenin glucosyltransferase